LLGACDGLKVEWKEGSSEGRKVGKDTLGAIDGERVGLGVRKSVGGRVGGYDGDGVGSNVG